jgi:GABA(A) receptor-associated protein
MIDQDSQMEENVRFTKEEYERLTKKYPGRIPVFVFRLRDSTDIPDIKKHKYLVPSDLTVGNFIYLIRKQLKLTPEKALYIFIGNTLPMSSMTMGQIYSLHRSEDGALRMFYTSENTFG